MLPKGKVSVKGIAKKHSRFKRVKQFELFKLFKLFKVNIEVRYRSFKYEGIGSARKGT